MRALDKTYDATPIASYRLPDPAANPAEILGASVYDNGSGAMINPGTYSEVLINGLYSGQQGYDLRYAANNIVID